MTIARSGGVINRDVPEQAITFAGQTLLGRVLTGQVQLGRVTKRSVHHVVPMHELMPQERKEFLVASETLGAQRDDGVACTQARRL